MSELSSEGRLWRIIPGALATPALAVVSDLRIADALADGPRTVEDIAREAGADADALLRFLRTLASEGVFVEEPRGVFGSTEACALLCQSTTG
jgi:hypothetical protein